MPTSRCLRSPPTRWTCVPAPVAGRGDLRLRTRPRGRHGRRDHLRDCSAAPCSPRCCRALRPLWPGQPPAAPDFALSCPGLRLPLPRSVPRNASIGWAVAATLPAVATPAVAPAALMTPISVSFAARVTSGADLPPCQAPRRWPRRRREDVDAAAAAVRVAAPAWLPGSPPRIFVLSAEPSLPCGTLTREDNALPASDASPPWWRCRQTAAQPSPSLRFDVTRLLRRACLEGRVWLPAQSSPSCLLCEGILSSGLPPEDQRDHQRQGRSRISMLYRC